MIRMTVFASLGLRSDVAKQGCHSISSFLRGDASWAKIPSYGEERVRIPVRAGKWPTGLGFP
jgi:hypothetical protein